MSGLRYLLDTNILSDIARNPQGRAARRWLEVGVESGGISIVVASEIRFGLAKSGAVRLVERLTEVLAQIEIVPMESPADEHYADIRGTDSQIICPNSSSAVNRSDGLAPTPTNANALNLRYLQVARRNSR